MKNRIIKVIVSLLAIGICVSISLAAPAAPTNVHVEDVTVDDGGSIRITWDLSVNDSEVTRYDILRSNLSSSEGFEIISDHIDNGTGSYNDTNTNDGVDYWYIVNATDGTNYSSSNASGPVYSVDEKPPDITAVTNGTVTNSTAIITWETHENSTSLVEYYNGSTSGHNETSDYVKLHEIILANLDPSTTYYYNVSSTDEAINTNTDGEYNFTTADDITVDDINPTVDITNPNDGNININANINATFSEKMDSLTLNTTSFLLNNSSSSISGEVSYNDSTMTATFSPSESLNYDTNYTATLTTDVTDLAGNHLDEPKIWSFTTEDGETPNNAPTVKDDSDIVEPTSGITPVTFNFSVTFIDTDNDNLTVKLYINGVKFEMEEFDSSDQDTYDGKDYVCNETFSEVDTYEYYFEASDGTDTVKSDEKEFEVHSATYYSGNRIWDKAAGMSEKIYTWNPQSFSGFYYDLDTDEGSETLTIKDIKRSLDEGDIEYITKPIPVDFENSRWGTYYVIGFMADRHFAGYNDTDFASSDDNLLSEEKLSKVLTDNDKKVRLNSGSVLELEEGYEFKITEFSSDGETIMVGIFKDGEKVDETVVNEGNTFVYEKDLGGAKDMPIIAIYIDTVFIGQETSSVNIEGIFQISDEYIDVERGDDFGQMTVKTVNENKITMENEDDVDLDEGDDFNLMGKINIIVADNNTLRFAPYVDMSESGTYELRGTVTEEDEFDWTPFNFEALMYDIDTGEGDETLRLIRDGRTVDDGDLTYTINPITKNFEHSNDDWNSFESIGFMGEKYFAGYLKASSFVSSDRSLISEGKLSKILIDEDEKHTMHIGNSLTLEEGYSLRIDEINRDGDAMMIALLKDGKEITTDIAKEGDTYLYEVDVDGTDIPIILAHIDSVFSGMETNSIFIDGIFQISDSFTSVEEGDTYG
ncbi:MAG TPA: hypothetical protein HA304_00365, partial [Methanosarcinales archaeon]|nr:hypothetical protein [Methanosarcinales archaeon]